MVVSRWIVAFLHCVCPCEVSGHFVVCPQLNRDSKFPLNLKKRYQRHVHLMVPHDSFIRVKCYLRAWHIKQFMLGAWIVSTLLTVL